MATQLEHLSTALSGRYRLERELGRGGMATVYLAEDLRHRRKVAIKVLKPELATALGPERFLREIDIVAKLTHPHILPLLDSGDAEGSLYYVMPYVPGDSIRQRLEREQHLPVAEAVRIAREVGSALDYAHRSGVVHRDVKPENILLVDGQAVVTDFGIARTISPGAGDTLTLPGFALGTPAYMSPEQASAETEVDGRADVYSLGCVLYEMLAGEPPFTGRNPQTIVARGQSQPTPSVRVVRDDVPEWLDRIVRRSLSRSPDDRYKTAEALRHALETAEDERRRRRLIGATIVLLAAGAVIGAGWWARGAASATVHRIESIAVLPFQNLSRDPEQEYFVDGMHDAIIAQLAQIGALRVTSRTSAARYKGSRKTLPEIARELNVDAVVEGAVLLAGDRVRIHVELLRAEPRERHLWGQTYDRHVRDVLALHSEVARAVASQVRASVTREERARLNTTRVVDPEAYRQYLLGNFHLAKYTEEAFLQALRHYRQAVEIDPAYAPAYAGQAVAYTELGSWASSLPPGAVRAEARAAALAALQRDSTLAEAHIALARIKQLFEWDWAGAEDGYQRGVALNPSATHALLIYANYLMSVGRFEEAATIGKRAVELDPLEPYAHASVGWALDHLGRDAEALEQYRKMLDLAPDQAEPYLTLAEFYLDRGKLDEAVRYAARADTMLGRTGPPAWMGRLGYAYGMAHRRADALRIVNDLRTRAAREYVPPTCPAVIYIALGEKQKALELLEQAYQQRDVIMVWLKVRHHFDPLRADPRFQDLLRRMNFPS